MSPLSCSLTAPNGSTKCFIYVQARLMTRTVMITAAEQRCVRSKDGPRLHQCPSLQLSWSPSTWTALHSAVSPYTAPSPAGPHSSDPTTTSDRTTVLHTAGLPCSEWAGNAVKGGLVTHTLTTLSPHTATATGGPSTTSAAHCGHTADTRKDYRTLHQPPQVCLCDQRGDHSHLYSPLLATRTPLSYTSHSHEYIGELCTHRHRHTRARTHSCISPPFPPLRPSARRRITNLRRPSSSALSVLSLCWYSPSPTPSWLPWWSLLQCLATSVTTNMEEEALTTTTTTDHLTVRGEASKWRVLHTHHNVM